MYTHQKEVNMAVNATMQLVNMFTDAVPDQQQMLQITATTAQLFATIQGVMAAEEQKQFKVKFFLKFAVALVQRAMDVMIPDATN